MRHLLPLCCLFLPLCLVADEFDDLLAASNPPARFADHVPQFSVSDETFTFQAMDGEWHWTFSVIKDGDRFVAVIPHTGFHGGTIYLLTHDPALAPTVLPMPKERWHIDTAIGYSFRTDQFIPDRFDAKRGSGNGSKEWNQIVDGKQVDSTQWIVSDDKTGITLKRVFKGDWAFEKWEHNTKKQKITVDHTGFFELTCHPQLGYMIAGTWDTGLSPDAPVGQYISLMPPGLSNPWPDAGVCQRVAICQKGTPGTIGWTLNGTAIDMAGGDDVLREGGFGVYLDEKTGWSNAMTLAGGDAKLSICNVHADLDYCVRWPDDLLVGADGLKHHTVVVRMLFFPPELTRHVWDTMKLKYTGGTVIMFPFGKVEDFEAQPFDLTTTERGMTFNGSSKVADKISTSEGHSGTHSVVLNGSLWPNIPQVVLKPGVKYRCSAWMKTGPMGDEAIVAHRAAYDAMVAEKRAGFPQYLEDQKAKWQEAVAKAEKRGKTPPPEPAWPTEPTIPAYEPPGAFITGMLYQWSPHNARKDNSWQDKYQTNIVPPGSDWTEVRFEFTSPVWGPFIDFVFHAQGGLTAYLDDWSFVEIPQE